MIFSCQICGVPKLRQRGVKVTASGKVNHYFTDDEGKIWNGHSCSPCHSATVREKAAKLRKPRVTRLCRKCSKPLPKNKYFLHTDCTPQITTSPFSLEEGIYDYAGFAPMRGKGA